MALTRSIGLTQATAMVVGTIVGSSIFVQPSEVSRAVPTFGGMLLVWVVAGALTWFGASICAELTSALPRTGGVYVFLREMFSARRGLSLGLGDVLEHALGHHRGHRDGVRALRSPPSCRSAILAFASPRLAESSGCRPSITPAFALAVQCKPD
jgi:amino acid transporter